LTPAEKERPTPRKRRTDAVKTLKTKGRRRKRRTGKNPGRPQKNANFSVDKAVGKTKQSFRQKGRRRPGRTRRREKKTVQKGDYPESLARK